MRWIAVMLTPIALLHPAVLKAADGGEQGLECHIRAVHKGEDDIIELKISLENTGDMPLRVMMPHPWYDMTPDSEMGGWGFEFIGPDGEAAKLDWGGPPPGPRPLMPEMDRMILLHRGRFVGMTVPLTGQLADLEKVSSLRVTYQVKKNFVQTHALRSMEWYKEVRPPLWEGKVQSEVFDIRRFVETKSKKR